MSGNNGDSSEYMSAFFEQVRELEKYIDAIKYIEIYLNIVMHLLQ